MTFKAMTVENLISLLEKFPADEQICMTHRLDQGTHITAINHVGHDSHGNLVVTLSDKKLIKQKGIK